MAIDRRQLLHGLAGAIGATALASCGAPSPASGPFPAPAATQPTGVLSPAPIAPTVAATPNLPAPTATPPPPTATPIPPTSTPIPPTATAAPVAASASPTPEPAPPTVGALPLFDTHLHYSQDAWSLVSVERAIQLMDQAGTRLALVSSTPDAGTLRLHAAAPERIIPVLRPYRTRDDMATWHSDPSIPTYLEEQLTLGVHRGIGEFHVYGQDAGSPVMTRVVQLAIARDLVLHAHSDEPAIERLFAVDGRARVLWAHAGFVGAAAVWAMVERFPNLWVEFAIRSDIGPGGRLGADWRVLIERYPERFMIGTDSYVPSRWPAMPAILGETRAWLATLPPPIGEAVAWRNAARLVGVDEAVFQGAKARG